MFKKKKKLKTEQKALPYDTSQEFESFIEEEVSKMTDNCAKNKLNDLTKLNKQLKTCEKMEKIKKINRIEIEYGEYGAVYLSDYEDLELTKLIGKLLKKLGTLRKQEILRQTKEMLK